MGEVPKALVVLKPNAAATEAELIEFCRAHLSHYKCPRSFEFVASLPKTALEKFSRKTFARNIGRAGIRFARILPREARR